MILMDGKKLRDKLLDEYKSIINKSSINATLAIIYVGNNEASKIYIRNKIKACEEVGIKTILYTLEEDVTEAQLVEQINELNNNSEITGIILQSPIPSHLNFDRIAQLIDPKKDVDGFTENNIYNLYLKNEKILPCTVKGIIKLLDEYNIPLKGKNVVIVGRGNIVGKPLALALLNRDATVTIAHSKTNNLKDITKNADILISAVGSPKLITSEMIKDNAVVVDVGISRVDGKVVGDVDFDNVSLKCSYITPVPGGVGPMTIAMIIDNILKMKEE